MSPPLACPDCPLCGHPPAFVLVGDVQAWCGNGACEAWTWNPSKTQAENVADIGRVSFREGPS